MFDGTKIVGLTNAHDHLEQFSMRGIGDGLNLEGWLNSGIRKMTRSISPETAFRSYIASLLTLARSGVTCTHHLHKQTHSPKYAEAVVRAAHTIGVRVVIYCSWRDEGGYAQSPKEAIREIKSLRVHESRGLVKFGLGIGSLWNCSSKGLREISKWAQEEGLPLQAHVAETRSEYETSVNRFGVSPVRRLADAGLLSESCEIVHAVHLNEQDWDLLVTSNSRIVHCPSSNALLQSGTFNLGEALRREIPVGVATDGAGSSVYSGPIFEAQLSLCIARTAPSSGGVVSRGDAVSLLTAPVLWDSKLFPERLEDRATFGQDDVIFPPVDILDLVSLPIDQLEVQGSLVISDGRLSRDVRRAIISEC